ncbi:MAG: XRE family transcriptional regulator [Victivallaceae bacterium]|nr:XRE family transcriptional regulator [Victivallaceae bacterium]
MQENGLQYWDFSVLRSLRRRENWSIADLCERSGVSTGVISKLERNLISAGLDTLHKIGKAFNITASELLSLAERRSSQRVTERDYKVGSFSFRTIRFGNVGCFYAEAKAGTRHSRAEAHEDEYELCWVLDGEVQIELPDERHRLTAGMSLQFDAMLRHSYEVLQDCRMIMVHIHKDNRF